MVRPEISIIVPVFNGEDTIGEQLDALLSQEVSAPYEIIVSDNRSTDATVSIVKGKSDSTAVPLRVVRAHAYVGAAYARNVGVLHSQAPLIAFCDADDRVDSGWLSAALAGLQHSDVVAGRFRTLCSPFRPNTPFLPYNAIQAGINGPTVLTGNSAFRKSVFIDAGGFDYGLPVYGGEDSELCLRMNKVHASYYFASDMIVYFRPTVGLRSRIRKVWLSSLAQPYIWRRHPDVFPEMALRRRGGDLVRSFVNLGNRRDLKAMKRFARSAVASVAHLSYRVRSGSRDLHVRHINSVCLDREEVGQG